MCVHNPASVNGFILKSNIVKCKLRKLFSFYMENFIFYLNFSRELSATEYSQAE